MSPLGTIFQRLVVVAGSLWLVRFDPNTINNKNAFGGLALAQETDVLSSPADPVTFGYTLHTRPDALDDQVTQVEKLVRTGLRKLIKNVTNSNVGGRVANLTSSYDGAADEDGTCPAHVGRRSNKQQTMPISSCSPDLS
jgi:hypothetical protein